MNKRISEYEFQNNNDVFDGMVSIEILGVYSYF